MDLKAAARVLAAMRLQQRNDPTLHAPHGRGSEVICLECQRATANPMALNALEHTSWCAVGRALRAVDALEELGAELQPVEARYRLDPGWFRALLVAAEDRARKSTARPYFNDPYSPEAVPQADGFAGAPSAPRVAGETQIPFGNDKGVGRVPEDDLASPMPERVTVCGGMRPRTGWESDARPVLTCDQPIGHEVSTPELRHWSREHGESWLTTAQREALESRENEAAR